MNHTTKLSIAQDYNNLGLKLFPVHTIESDGRCTCFNPNCNNTAKHPVTTNGLHAATDNNDKLKEYFTGDYDQANIGIATGESSNVFVLDVDDIGSLKQLESEHEPLPRTWTVETPRGGRHLYFRFDVRLKDVKNTVKFFGSIDIRSTGGYVIAPPSLGSNGKQYRWLISPAENEIAPVPDWLVKMLPKRDRSPAPL